MIRSAFSSVASVSFVSRVSCRLLTLVLASVIVIAGCQRGGPKTTVKGKVTLDGQPVNGQVVVVGADGKQVPGGIVGGMYTIPDPPTGEVTFMIRGMGSLGGAPPMKSDAPKLKDKASNPSLDSGPPSMGVEPPAKYAKKEGGIKQTITAGKTNEIDLPLTK